MNRTFVKKMTILLLTLLVLSACNGTTNNIAQQTVIPTNTSILSPTAAPQPVFPAFSDWRAAYMASNQSVHAVTLDGKSDISGPILKQYTNQVYPVNDEISPDGHTFAYTSLGNFNIINLQTGIAANFTDQNPPFGVVYTAFWSQNGQYMAVGDNGPDVGIITMTNYTDFTLPLHLTSDQRIFLIGWIDASHVAIFTHIGDTNGQYDFESISVPDGRQKVIAVFQQNIWNGNLFYPTISPDGSQILVSNSPFRNYPFTPHVAVINTETGQVRNFPSIVRQTGGNFTTIAWRPGYSNSVAVSNGFNINNNAGAWMLNLATDSAAFLAKDWYPTAWSPDSKTLILSTESFGEGQSPPFSIEAMTFDSQMRIASQIILSKSAYGFPFVGFIKTSS